MSKTDTPKATPLDGIAAAIAADPALQAENLGAGPSGPPGQEEAQAAPELTNAQLFGAALGMGTELFTVITQIKAPKAILTPERCAQLGELWGPVLDKYGINAGQFMGAWQLEITALMGTVAIGLELRAAVRQELAQRAKEQEARTVPDDITGHAVPA